MSSESGKSSLFKLFDPSNKIPHFEIDNVTRKALCFRENLIISLKDDLTSDTKPLGGYCVSLESFGPEGKEFMIQVISSLSMNGAYAGSKVLSSTTAKLHCLEEKRTEYIHRDDGLHEKILFIGLEDDLYHLEGEDLCPCDKSKWQKDLPLCSSGEMISEGAHLLLMRYLALKNFHGNLSFQSVMIGGQITTCNYRCSEAQSMKINGHIAEVYTIERRMHEECGLVHNAKTHMDPRGYILRHDWLEVPYLLKINSLLDPNEIYLKKSRIAAPLRSQWSSDVQLMSMYLDKKTCKIAQQSEYLTDHPEIRQLISDYTQTLLAGNQLAEKAAFLPSFLRELSRHKPRPVCSICGICFDCPMSEQPPLHGECDRVTPSSRYPLREPESSEFSLCSVFSKCPSDATCVRKLSRNSSMTVTCSDDCKACKSDGKKNSRCSFYPECDKTCDGCRPLGEPCRVHKACPECPGCHQVCSEIGVCPNCKKCNIEILPESGVSGCRKSGAESMEHDLNPLNKE